MAKTKRKTTKGGPSISRAELLALIRRHDGNVVHMAAEVGKPRKSLYRRIEAEGLQADLDATRRGAELRDLRRAVDDALDAGDRRRAWHALIELHDAAGDVVTGDKLVLWMREAVEELMHTRWRT